MLTGALLLAAEQGPDCSKLALCRSDRVVVVTTDRPDLPGVVSARARGLVQLEVTQAELVRLHALDVVVREPFIASPMEVTSEGLADVFSTEDWHAAGLSGEGVTVAIFDVGFRGYENHLGTELPDEVETHFYPGWDDLVHGTQVTEVLHDVAPGADLRLYYFWTDVEFLESVEHIAAAGDIDVVNASIGFENIHHTDGTSLYSEAVAELIEGGVHWFNAAGNEGANTWTGRLGDYTPVKATVDGGSVYVNLRWMDDWGASANDLDLVLEGAESGEVCGRSRRTQDGSQDPYESVRCDSDDDLVRVVIEHDGAPDDLEVVIWTDEEITPAQPDRSLVLPADARDANAVAAVFWESDELAWYSSWGPTDDGREKPDLSAPTYVTVASGAGWFGGTSCASPHAAGAGALLLEALGPMPPAELTAELRARTRDLGSEGWDPQFGAGYLALGDVPQVPVDSPVDSDDAADSAPARLEDPEDPEQRGCGCATGAPVGWAALIGALLLRRSRGPRSRR